MLCVCLESRNSDTEIKFFKVSLNIKEKIYTKGFSINKYIPVQ